MGRPLGDLWKASRAEPGANALLRPRAGDAGPRLLDQLRHLLRGRLFFTDVGGYKLRVGPGK